MQGPCASFLCSSLGGSLVRDLLWLAYLGALGWTIGISGSGQWMDRELTTNPGVFTAEACLRADEVNTTFERHGSQNFNLWRNTVYAMVVPPAKCRL